MEKSASDKQIEFMKNLGIHVEGKSFTIKEASHAISIAVAKQRRDYFSSFKEGEEVWYSIHKMRCVIERIRPFSDLKDVDRALFTVKLPNGKRRAVKVCAIKKIRKLSSKKEVIS